MGSVNVRVLVVVAFSVLGAGCKSDSPVEPLPPLPQAARIDAIGAVTFSGVVGSPVAPAPAVRVTDETGKPVAQVQVTFTVSAGNGSLGSSVVATDADGRASTAWTLGTVIQANTLTASVGSLSPVVFTAMPVAAQPAMLIPIGSTNRIAAVGSVVASPLRAQITDSFHNPVSGLAVSFSVISGGGTVDPVASISDTTGIVSATWTLGPVEGVQTAQVRISGLTVLFSADTFDCAGATASAPCTGIGELVFVRSDDTQIYRMNVDGTALTRLTSEGNNSDPKWSPDGKRIAFVRFSSLLQSSDVYVMDADGSNVVRRTNGGQYYYVTWSPDGRSLAAEGVSGSDSLNIYSVSPDDAVTTPTVLITNGGSPAWSPDGKRIAYAHGTGYYDASQIYVRNADGSDAHRFTPDSAGWNWSPAWSPDGKKFSFTRCTGGCGVFIMDLSSSAVTLAAWGAGVQDAAWSPDGRWLALTVYGSGPPSVSYVPSGGGNPRLVFSNAYQPSWRPPAH